MGLLLKDILIKWNQLLLNTHEKTSSGKPSTIKKTILKCKFNPL